MHNWKKRLDAAISEREILSIVREYVANLSEGDISRLPEPCQPRRFETAEDVRSFTLALSRHSCFGDGATARLLARMFEFFANAEGRLMAMAAN